MRFLFILILLSIILASCGGSGGGSSSSSSPTIVTIPAFTFGFATSSTNNFDSNSSYWTQTNNGVTETKNSSGMVLTGAVNSDKLYSYKGHFSSTYTVSEIGFSFASENKTGNQVEVTTDFGSGNKIVTTIVFASASYISSLNSSNTVTFNAYTKVYSSNTLVNTSTTDSISGDPSSWDSSHGYSFSSSLTRTSSGQVCSDMSGSMLSIGHSYCVTSTQASSWGLTGSPNYYIQMKAGASNTMALEIYSLIQNQAQGYYQ